MFRYSNEQGPRDASTSVTFRHAPDRVITRKVIGDVQSRSHRALSAIEVTRRLVSLPSPRHYARTEKLFNAKAVRSQSA